MKLSYLSFLLSTGSLAPTAFAYSNESQLNDSPARMLRRCDGIDFGLELLPDLCGAETTWAITDQDTGYFVLFGGPYTAYYDDYIDNDVEIIYEDACLDRGCYEFVISDSYGDGLDDNSYYVLTVDGNIIRESYNNTFGYYESTSFCSSPISTPTSAPITPTLDPTLSPTSPPVGVCVDSTFPIAFTELKSSISCEMVSAGCLCDESNVRSHCPSTCDSCEEYSCVDSTATFYTQRGFAGSCALAGGKDPDDIAIYCKNDNFRNMCRGLCGVCD